MTTKVELSELFVRAGITEEEFRKYFLEPLYPNQHPSIIDGIVYTEESDGESNFAKTVEQGHIVDLLGEFQDLFLTVFTERGLDKKVFIEWMAHQSTLKASSQPAQRQLQLQPQKSRESQRQVAPGQQSTSGQSPSLSPSQSEQKQQQSQNTSAAAPASSVNIAPSLGAEARSAVGNIARGLRNVALNVSRRLRGMFPRRRRDDNSRRGEGRDLAKEQKEERRDRKDSGIKEAAEEKTLQVKEQTKDLARQLNILDAVYDNMKFVTEMRRMADAMAQDKFLSAQEINGAKALSAALQNPGQVKGLELTTNQEIIVQFNNQAVASMRQSSISVRLTGRLASLAASFSRTAIATQTEALKNALSDVGGLALGKGGKDVKGIEPDETHNQRAAEKLKNLQNKNKEI